MTAPASPEPTCRHCCEMTREDHVHMHHDFTPGPTYAALEAAVAERDARIAELCAALAPFAEAETDDMTEFGLDVAVVEARALLDAALTGGDGG